MIRLAVALAALALASCAPHAGAIMRDGASTPAPWGCRDYLRRHPEAARC